MRVCEPRLTAQPFLCNVTVQEVHSARDAISNKRKIKRADSLFCRGFFFKSLEMGAAKRRLKKRRSSIRRAKEEGGEIGTNKQAGKTGSTRQLKAGRAASRVA